MDKLLVVLLFVVVATLLEVNGVQSVELTDDQCIEKIVQNLEKLEIPSGVKKEVDKVRLFYKDHANAKSGFDAQNLDCNQFTLKDIFFQTDIRGCTLQIGQEEIFKKLMEFGDKIRDVVEAGFVCSYQMRSIKEMEEFGIKDVLIDRARTSKLERGKLELSWKLKKTLADGKKKLEDGKEFVSDQKDRLFGGANFHIPDRKIDTLYPYM